MKIDGDLIDDLIEKNHHVKIANYCKVQFSITNYGIYSNDGFVCFTGSDIIDADNICCKLRKLYPNKDFNITEEFMSFT